MNIEELTEELKDLKGFEEWLKSKNPDDVVGVAGEACDCPISTWLKEKHELQGVATGVFSIDWMGERVELPLLTEKFVHAVDSRFSRPVSAQTALRLLENVRGIFN